jgi:predicted neuraminidase
LQPTLQEQGYIYILGKNGESTGIYYENKGQLNLYNTEWRVVVYTNLKEIDSQSNDVVYDSMIYGIFVT